MSSLFQAAGDCRETTPADAAPGEFTASFVFPPEFCGFAGHFPGNPVLPGIAQIMAVLHACGAEAPHALLAVKSCKFLRPVGPDERVVASGNKIGTAGGIMITAKIWAGDAVCAAMTLSVAESGEEVFAP
jgi:3-hydroxyacyl-[acyl-carrier-protein] dehydratase